MPILPIIPQKSKYKRTPSITFRRVIFLLLISFAGASGIGQLIEKDNTPTILAKAEFIPKTYSQSALPKTTAVNTQVNQIDIGIQKITPTDTPMPLSPAPTTNNTDNTPWGVAKQIDTDTWTMKIGQDNRMATPQEILDALNNYRQRYGRGQLAWDQKLIDYANSRASYFTSLNKLDSHAGFLDYVHNQDGFHKLGFASLGENSSIGYTLEGVHLIEWVYAGDKPHNDNQLNPQWQYVGIGVNGSATDLIFAANKL
jgi:uncharacterized protein YkwD